MGLWDARPENMSNQATTFFSTSVTRIEAWLLEHAHEIENGHVILSFVGRRDRRNALSYAQTVLQYFHVHLRLVKLLITREPNTIQT